MSKPAFLMPAGSGALPGLFFGQAFTVFALSFDLWVPTNEATRDAVAAFYFRKAVQPSTLMMVIQILLLLGGVVSYGKVLFGVIARGGSTKRKLADLIGSVFFVLMTGFTVTVILPLEAALGKQWTGALPADAKPSLSLVDFTAKQADLYYAHLIALSIALGMAVTQAIAFATQRVTVEPEAEPVKTKTS